jgi:3-hydroxybutyryl-CoA dehydratase
MQLKLGDHASLSKTITQDDVAEFARITLDTNPLHLDEEFAKQTRFGGRIVHGMLGAGLISAVIGTKLGGPIYLGQTLKFLKPIRMGETLTATAEVIADRGFGVRRPDICGPRRYPLASRAKVGIAILCTCGHRALPLLPQLTDNLHNLGIAFSDGTIDAQIYARKRDAYQAELAALIIPEDTQIIDGGLYLETLRDLWSAATPQEMHDSRVKTKADLLSPDRLAPISFIRLCVYAQNELAGVRQMHCLWRGRRDSDPRSRP